MGGTNDIGAGQLPHAGPHGHVLARVIFFGRDGTGSPAPGRNARGLRIVGRHVLPMCMAPGQRPRALPALGPKRPGARTSGTFTTAWSNFELRPQGPGGPEREVADLARRTATNRNAAR